MSIGNNSHIAHLTVEVGTTSINQLMDFYKEAAAKGGGEDVRAVKNPDNSYTLYVPKTDKPRMSSVFSSYGATARAEKRALAKEVIIEALQAKMPKGVLNEKIGLAILKPLNDATSLKVKDLVSPFAKAGVLSDHMDKARAQYSKTDGILSNPEFTKLFEPWAEKCFLGENLKFAQLHVEFEKAETPAAKLKAAEKMLEMMPDMNVDGAKNTHVRSSMAEVHRLIAEGTDVSDIDFSEVAQALSGANDHVKVELDRNIQTYAGSQPKFHFSPEFEATVIRLYEADQAAYNESIAVRDTPLAQSIVDHYGSLENLLSNPEMRETAQKNFDQQFVGESFKFLCLKYDMDHATTPAEKLKFAEELFKLMPPLGDDGGSVPMEFNELDGSVTVNRPDPIVSGITREMEALRTQMQLDPDHADFTALKNEFTKATGNLGALLNDNHNVSKFTDSSEFQTLAKQAYTKDNYTGPETNPLLNLSPGSGLLFKETRAAFMRDEFPALNPAPTAKEVDKIIADRLLSQELDIRPGSDLNDRGWNRFQDAPLQGSGGATGSGRAKVGNKYYQVKSSIEHGGRMRKLKAGFKNHENYGEVIASNLSRSLVGTANQHLIPKVGLRQDFTRHEAVVTSEYLKGGVGDLGAFYKSQAGNLPVGQKHPKIQLGSPSPSGDGFLRLSGVAAQDVRRNLALSALMGDHDVNPGNMIATGDGRIGRIDFGHAFNELITGFGGKLTGGGGLHNPKNRILDFFNRETISGITSAMKRPKLWRDYDGASASHGMTDALRELASSKNQLEGIAIAKSQFSDMVAGLEVEGGPSSQKQINDITSSLKKIAENIGKPVTASSPSEIVKEVFDGIELYLLEGQMMMQEVSNLSDLQAQIDDFIAQNPGNIDAPIPEGISSLYNQLLTSSVGLESGDGLTFMKMSREHQAFSGDLQSYVAERRAQRL